MKILYLANLRLPTEKAYGIQIAKTCESLARSGAGVELELAAPHRRNKIKEDFFEYYGIKRNFKFKKIWAPDFYLSGRLDKPAVAIKGLISAKLLFLYALTCEADIIYTRDEWTAYLLSFFKKNIFFEAHRFSRSRAFFYRRFGKSGVRVIVISRGLKGDFLSLGFPEARLLEAPDGVDLEEFDLPISREKATEELGLPLDKKIIMYAGHLYEWKGAALLLDAARSCQSSISQPVDGAQNKLKDVLFVFVGGTEYDVREFKKKAEGLDNVIILGHKPHNRIPLYLKVADVLVLPNSAKEEISKKYTSPLKLFEYMASGRPIIASDLPSLREVLNEENSILINPDDAEDMALALRRVLNDKNLADKIAAKALNDVKNYTWGERADKILGFLR